MRILIIYPSKDKLRVDLQKGYPEWCESGLCRVSACFHCPAKHPVIDLTKRFSQNRKILTNELFSFCNCCSLIGKIVFVVEWKNFIVSRGKEEMSQSTAVDLVVNDRGEFEVLRFASSSWRDMHLFRVAFQVGFSLELFFRLNLFSLVFVALNLLSHALLNVEDQHATYDKKHWIFNCHT